MTLTVLTVLLLLLLVLCCTGCMAGHGTVPTGSRTAAIAAAWSTARLTSFTCQACGPNQVSRMNVGGVAMWEPWYELDGCSSRIYAVAAAPTVGHFRQL
jgi:hypothetical protein